MTDTETEFSLDRDVVNDWGRLKPLRRLMSLMYRGGRVDPSELAAPIPTVVTESLWHDVPTITGTKHFDTFSEFCAYTKMSAVELMNRLRFNGFDAEAKMVGDLIAPIGPPGTNQHSDIDPDADGPTDDDLVEQVSDGPCNTRSIEHPFIQDADYVITRLKRDDPDLADSVIAGEITPHAAAVKSGIRKPRATYRTDDVQAAVRALLRSFTPAEIRCALDELED